MKNITAFIHPNKHDSQRPSCFSQRQTDSSGSDTLAARYSRSSCSFITHKTNHNTSQDKPLNLALCLDGDTSSLTICRTCMLTARQPDTPQGRGSPFSPSHRPPPLHTSPVARQDSALHRVPPPASLSILHRVLRCSFLRLKTSVEMFPLQVLRHGNKLWGALMPSDSLRRFLP